MQSKGNMSIADLTEYFQSVTQPLNSQPMRITMPA